MGVIGSLLSSRPYAGSQPNSCANTHCSINASQKIGIDTPNKAKNMARKSNQEFCFQALIIPAFTPITTAKSIAKKVNSNVAASFGSISTEISAFDRNDV